MDNNFYLLYHPPYVIHHSSLLFSTMMVQAVFSFNIPATTWDNTCYSPKDDCKWISWFVLWDGKFPVAYMFILETWEDRSYSVTFLRIRIISCCTIIRLYAHSLWLAKKCSWHGSIFFFVHQVFFVVQGKSLIFPTITSYSISLYMTQFLFWSTGSFCSRIFFQLLQSNVYCSHKLKLSVFPINNYCTGSNFQIYEVTLCELFNIYFKKWVLSFCMCSTADV